MLCRIKSMNHRASLHDPRNMFISTKMNRWNLGGLENLNPFAFVLNMSPVDVTKSNHLGMSIGFCTLP